jgi:hypothetical protein
METSPEAPTLEMYGLSESEVSYIKERKRKIENKWRTVSNGLLAATLGCFLFSLANPIMWAVTGAMLAVIFLAIKTVELVENRIPKIENYSNYQTRFSIYTMELKEYQRRTEDQRRLEESRRQKEERKIKRREFHYWSSLDPYEFEKEVARIYKLNGYESAVTKGSGDGGIDIHLFKDGKKGIVQCKRYRKRVGPGPVRDLYGTMVGGKFKFAKLVCPAGFSEKAYEFSRGKNIELVGLKRIMNLVKESEREEAECTDFKDFDSLLARVPDADPDPSDELSAKHRTS